MSQPADVSAGHPRFRRILKWLAIIVTLLIVAGVGTGFYLYKVGSSRVDLQACKLEYSIVSPK